MYSSAPLPVREIPNPGALSLLVNGDQLRTHFTLLKDFTCSICLFRTRRARVRRIISLEVREEGGDSVLEQDKQCFSAKRSFSTSVILREKTRQFLPARLSLVC